MNSRSGFRVVVVGALLLGVLAISPLSAFAQPGVGGGGVDVLGDGGSGANVVVQGGFVQAPSVSQGSGGSGGASTAGAGGTSTNSGGGGTAAANNGPAVLQRLSCSNLRNNCDAAPSAPGIDVPPTPPSMAEIMNAVGTAITAMQLEAPEMCFTPEPADTPGGRVGLVGRQGWAWVCTNGASVRPSQVGPVTRTAVAPGGLVVNATAVNSGVAVNFGDGDAIVCPGALLPFTPYTDIVDASPLTPPSGMPSPTCGHLIEKASIGLPDGSNSFKVTASSAWIVNWTVIFPGGGTGGVIPVPLTSTYQQRIGELQVLVTPN